MIDPARAITYAAVMHEGQQYGAGTDDAEPYFNHVFRVAERVGHTHPRFRSVALLHDVIEDTSATIDDLVKDLNPDTWEIKALNLLTRDDSETYSEYIDRILAAGDDEGALCARVVKQADLIENSGRITAKMQGLVRRYTTALERLARA